MDTQTKQVGGIRTQGKLRDIFFWGKSPYQETHLSSVIVKMAIGNKIEAIQNQTIASLVATRFGDTYLILRFNRSDQASEKQTKNREQGQQKNEGFNKYAY